MKTIQIINLLLLFFCKIACANNQPPSDDTVKKPGVETSISLNDSLEPGKIISPVFCKADPSQSYAVYIPVKGNKEALPVIYFFDPHGNGSLPLNKYKALADLYNFILIGSNNSKNGNDWPATESTWNNLFNDSRKRLKIDGNRVYACGFSGGARVACSIALNHDQVKGVIANSAGLPDITNGANLQFSFTGIAGEGDMNMTELVSTGAVLDKTQMRHRIILFDGKHEWAPQNTMDMAFAGLQLDAMHDKLTGPDVGFINHYTVSGKQRITDYLKANNYIKAEEQCAFYIAVLDGLTGNVNWFKEKNSSIKSNPVYQKQWQSRQKLLVTEQNLKQIYEQNFQQGDMNYWTKTILELQTKTKSITAESAMYQRLLAYLSLAFYSISNQLINGHRDKEAQHFVDLYKIVDSTNSEAWYFSGLLNARNNNARATEADLLKAVANGFTDKNRMMRQPEFQHLKTQINFAEIESKMK